MCRRYISTNGSNSNIITIVIIINTTTTTTKRWLVIVVCQMLWITVNYIITTWLYNIRSILFSFLFFLCYPHEIFDQCTVIVLKRGNLTLCGCSFFLFHCLVRTVYISIPSLNLVLFDDFIVNFLSLCPCFVSLLCAFHWIGRQMYAILTPQNTWNIVLINIQISSSTELQIFTIAYCGILIPGKMKWSILLSK